MSSRRLVMGTVSGGAGRGRIGAVAGLAVAVLLVLGVAGWKIEKPEPADRAGYVPVPCPTPNVHGVPPLGPEFSCGYLTVPENRAKIDGRTIKIAVARLKAAAAHPKPDPVVWLTGGPGGSGLLDAVTMTRLKPVINADREIVFVDQRGTGRSDPLLSCPEIDVFTRRAVALVSTDLETPRKGVEATRACRTRLAKMGYDLAAYNTTENAADIADLRTALGIREWNVYGCGSF